MQGPDGQGGAFGRDGEDPADGSSGDTSADDASGTSLSADGGFAAGEAPADGALPDGSAPAGDGQHGGFGGGAPSQDGRGEMNGREGGSALLTLVNFFSVAFVFAALTRLAEYLAGRRARAKAQAASEPLPADEA